VVAALKSSATTLPHRPKDCPTHNSGKLEKLQERNTGHTRDTLECGLCFLVSCLEHAHAVSHTLSPSLVLPLLTSPVLSLSPLPPPGHLPPTLPCLSPQFNTIGTSLTSGQCSLSSSIPLSLPPTLLKRVGGRDREGERERGREGERKGGGKKRRKDRVRNFCDQQTADRDVQFHTIMNIFIPMAKISYLHM
jgi:hypothetical protein